MYGHFRMHDDETPSAPRPVSAWGDREQRRRDVLDAAALTIKQSGWVGLSMREVARGAGVSPGAIYQWFDGKDEIFAELFRAKLWAGVNLVVGLPDDVSLHDFMRTTLEWVIELWAELGRYLLDFTDMATDASPWALDHGLAEPFREMAAAASNALSAAAARGGVEVIEHPQRPRWIWGSMIGTAEHVIALRLNEDPEELEAYVDFAVLSLIASLSAS